VLATIFGSTVSIREALVLYRRHQGALTLEMMNKVTHGKRSPIGFAAGKIDYEKKRIELKNRKLHYEDMSTILDNLKIEDQTLADRAARAAALYREQAVLHTRRCVLYDKNRMDGLRYLAAMLLSASYRPRSAGGFGAVGCVSDLIKVLAVGRR
jgi:hypothetical protein